MISSTEAKVEDSLAVLPNFKIHLPFLQREKKPLTLASTRRRREAKQMAAATTKTTPITNCEPLQENAKGKENDPNEPENSTTSFVSYSEEEMDAFKENMVAANTKKNTSVAVRRLKAWYKEKYGMEINLEQISKSEAPNLLQHFFVEIRQTTKENKGKEYEPGTLQTY